MTGSLLLLNRQHSSTSGYSSNTKIIRSKLRRCSSADDQNSIEVTPDENQYKGKFSTKFDPTVSDNDSGIEDFDQQNAKVVRSNTNNVDEEEESSPCFGPCEDEIDEENPIENFQNFANDAQQSLQRIHNDLLLAGQISHEEKKEFCLNTSEVFHAEFARLISWPMSLNYPGINYYLLVEDGMNSDPCEWPNFFCVKLDNAKAQFKCPNVHCRRLWTSMRARISFKISHPGPQGFVILKIYGQNCQSCETPADALWYMEEVCRVMENLSKSMFETFFPSTMTDHYLQGTKIIQTVDKYSRRSSHDPQQRKGKMHAPHNKNHCEACQRGLCFN